MAFDIAKEYGLSVIEVLTGFKYIGEQIKLFEEAKEKNGGKLDYTKYAFEYEFGYEESYGCLVGTHARDKDAVMAVTALCEAAAYYKDKGMTLWDQMQNIYKKYGYYKEGLATQTLPGADGAAKISAMMEAVRENPPKTIGGCQVLALRDYEKGIRYDFINNSESDSGLPKSDVIYFELENNGWCCIRPSGTEPKIKFYFGVKERSDEDAQRLLEAIKKELLASVDME